MVLMPPVNASENYPWDEVLTIDRHNTIQKTAKGFMRIQTYDITGNSIAEIRANYLEHQGMPDSGLFPPALHFHCG